MANAKFDENRVPVMLGVLNTDGITPTMVQADPTGHFVLIDDDVTGSDLSADQSYRDGNLVTTMIAVSEVDGVTPVPLYVNSSGKLLVDSS